MTSLAQLTVADFASRLDESFQIEYRADQPITVSLIEARAGAVNPAGQRPSFSLLFLCTEVRGGSPRSYLVQGTYRFNHPTLGPLDLFSVPIGPHPQRGGMTYQVIFG